ncbi:hypothetical protein J4E91_009497 [Alternaria rosae]|nr:hypothetical protein J4E91_009497 [Alternaria rosae]
MARRLTTIQFDIKRFQVRYRSSTDALYEVVQTPVTPVSAEGLTSLFNQIAQESRDDMGRDRYQRLVEKLGNAAQTSFARQALDQDYIQFLSNMNNEAQVRRKTRSTVLSNGKGEGRVVTFEHLEAARADRTEKETAIEAKGKGKRGRKPKSALGIEYATVYKGKPGKKRKSAAQEPEPGSDLEPELQQTPGAPLQTSGTNVTEAVAVEFWRAPVARMW